VVGWQGLIREFAADGWIERVPPGRSPFLEAASLIVASLDDIDGTTELVWLRELAPRSTIVLTAGEGGGVVLGDGVARRYHAIPAGYLVDATGAGDVFLAALTAAWLFTGQIATPAALRFAAAAASCSVEGAGVAGVPTRAQVAARLL
jgi:sugar/nucleoside kinase (ribokinase family)